MRRDDALLLVEATLRLLAMLTLAGLVLALLLLIGRSDRVSSLEGPQARPQTVATDLPRPPLDQPGLPVTC